jgi:hypothetical protein
MVSAVDDATNEKPDAGRSQVGSAPQLTAHYADGITFTGVNPPRFSVTGAPQVDAPIDSMPPPPTTDPLPGNIKPTQRSATEYPGELGPIDSLPPPSAGTPQARKLDPPPAAMIHTMTATTDKKADTETIAYTDRAGKDHTVTLPAGHPVLENFHRGIEAYWTDLKGAFEEFEQKMGRRKVG